MPSSITENFIQPSEANRATHVSVVDPVRPESMVYGLPNIDVSPAIESKNTVALVPSEDAIEQAMRQKEVVVKKSFGGNLWFFLKNFHPLVGIFAAHPRHPYKKGDRIMVFFCSFFVMVILTTVLASGMCCAEPLKASTSSGYDQCAAYFDECTLDGSILCSCGSTCVATNASFARCVPENNSTAYATCSRDTDCEAGWVCGDADAYNKQCQPAPTNCDCQSPVDGDALTVGRPQLPTPEQLPGAFIPSAESTVVPGLNDDENSGPTSTAVGEEGADAAGQVDTTLAGTDDPDATDSNAIGTGTTAPPEETPSTDSSNGSATGGNAAVELTVAPEIAPAAGSSKDFFIVAPDGSRAFSLGDTVRIIWRNNAKDDSFRYSIYLIKYDNLPSTGRVEIVQGVEATDSQEKGEVYYDWVVAHSSEFVSSRCSIEVCIDGGGCTEPGAATFRIGDSSCMECTFTKSNLMDIVYNSLWIALVGSIIASLAEQLVTFHEVSKFYGLFVHRDIGITTSQWRRYSDRNSVHGRILLLITLFMLFFATLGNLLRMFSRRASLDTTYLWLCGIGFTLVFSFVFSVIQTIFRFLMRYNNEASRYTLNFQSPAPNVNHP